MLGTLVIVRDASLQWANIVIACREEYFSLFEMVRMQLLCAIGRTREPVVVMKGANVKFFSGSTEER